MPERTIFPRIGEMPIKAITPAHILEVLKGVAQDNDPSVAAEAKRTMSGVFELAIATLRASNDPVHPVRKALPRKQNTAQAGTLDRGNWPTFTRR